MKQVLAQIILLIITTLLLNIVYASKNQPNTFLGPTLKGRYTSPFSHFAAFSVFGEAGRKNLRGGDTIGFVIAQDHHLKFSAEHLRQQITYSFLTGKTDQWVDQWAGAAEYQYLLPDYYFHSAFDLSAYYSHAVSKRVRSQAGIINVLRRPVTITGARHIAGSNAWGLNPGVAFSGWVGNRTLLILNYDNVTYNNNYLNRDSKGYGGTIQTMQAISQHIAFGLGAAVRQPFNNYTASLHWHTYPFLGGAWSISLDGDYTVGKQGLPNTWNVSLGLSYLFEPCAARSGEALVANPILEHFYAWTARPAVYMPQVLAVGENNLRRS